jgi:hypothetical protein
MYVECIFLLLFPHEYLYFHNIFVCLEFYIYTDEIVFKWHDPAWVDRYVTNWYQSIVSVFYGVAWLGIGGWGCYIMVSEPQFSTLSLDGPCKWKLKLNFHRESLSKWPNFELQSIHECQEGVESTP